MWIRFETKDSGLGLFHERGRLSLGLSPFDRDYLGDLVLWFNHNLNSPFAAYTGQTRFWFKGSAKKCIEKAFELARLYRKAGIPIRIRRVTKVQGQLVIGTEDENQAAFDMDNV